MSSIEVTEKCTGCAQCPDSCPVNAITMKNKQAVIDRDTCTLCSACVNICPVDAITIEAKKKKNKNLDNYQDIWVFAEQRQGQILPSVYELIGEGRKLADRLDQNLCVALLGNEITKQAEKLFSYGVDIVYTVDRPELEKYNDSYYTAALTDLVKSYLPSIILLGATTIGRSLGPRVAARLKTGLTADCTELDIDTENNNLLQIRPAFGGNIMATIVCENHRPQMATIRPGVMQPAEPEFENSGEIIEHSFEPSTVNNQITIKEIVREKMAGIDIGEADIIVSGGRGVGSAQNFALIEELAAALDGAVGASRAAVDNGWISQKHQVGQTGSTVSPRIYIACGISGAVQHLVGMENSDIIIAINKDPEAPIFKHASYGLVGDLFEIVPLLIENIKNNYSGKNDSKKTSQFT